MNLPHLKKIKNCLKDVQEQLKLIMIVENILLESCLTTHFYGNPNRIRYMKCNFERDFHSHVYTASIIQEQARPPGSSL